MSDAAAAKDAPPKKSKKMLFILLAALGLGAGGGGAWYFLSAKKGGEEEHAVSKAEEKKAAQHVFVTLENFVVNLADRDSERYAQLGVVLEMEDKAAETRLTAKMPAVRNQILLLLSSKHAADLVTREGKETLATEIALAAALPLGWTPPDPEEEAEEAAPRGKEGDKAKRKPKPKRPPPPPNPVVEVHFASLLVQ